MNRLTVEFEKSAPRLADCPRWKRREIALCGRSNVGKSSLLNALAGAHELARTSKTPGRTQLLNFFALDAHLALCDMPGYGYAKMPHDRAEAIALMMREYLDRRDNLAAIVLLVDCRRGPAKEELSIAELARARGLTLIAVATKIDKLTNSERRSALAQFAPLGVDPIPCSVSDGEGIQQLRRAIMAIATGRDDHAVR
jgi:GTP-binding protein